MSPGKRKGFIPSIIICIKDYKKRYANTQKVSETIPKTVKFS